MLSFVFHKIKRNFCVLTPSPQSNSEEPRTNKKFRSNQNKKQNITENIFYNKYEKLSSFVLFDKLFIFLAFSPVLILNLRSLPISRYIRLTLPNMILYKTLRKKLENTSNVAISSLLSIPRRHNYKVLNMKTIS